MFAFEYLLPRNVLWPTTLMMFSMHIKEPMFHISSCFNMFWQGFESLKVGCLLLLWWCILFRISESPVWPVITLTQLILLRKFLFYFILEVKDLLCFRFELMMNLFDHFLNVIPHAICKVLLVPKFRLIVTMFEMS